MIKTVPNVSLLWIPVVLTIVCPMAMCDQGFPSKWRRALELLCPYNTICRDEPPHILPNYTNGIGCCTDCSCDDDCGLTESCCLPEMDTHHVVDRSQQQCLYPTNKNTIPDDIVSYNMVVDRYPDGKGVDCGNDVMTCGNNNLATPIGALYPIYSKKTGRIYKNIKCAKCHGIDEQDMVKFEVHLQCENLFTNVTLLVDITASFSVFENTKLAPNCQFLFYYPGPSAEIKTEQCFQKQIQCKDDFYVDDSLNMTKEEIKLACYSGLKTYNGMTRFCAICTGNNYVNSLRYRPVCRSKDDSVRVMGAALTALIEPRLLEWKNGNHKDDRSDMIACSKVHINEDQVIKDCRAVRCPTGKIRMYDGKCVFPTRVLNNNFLSIHLKLIPKTPIFDIDLFMLDVSSVVLFRTNSPWKSNWEIDTVVYKTKMDAGSGLQIDTFFIAMYFIRQHRPLSKLLSDISHTINLPWLISINGTQITLSQTFSEYDRMYKVSNVTVNPVTSDITGVRLSDYTQYEKLPVYNILLYNRVTGRIPITKMFFCDQIQLRPNEYKMYLDLSFFYHTLLNKTFHLGEFTYIFDGDGNGIPRICLEDSEFTGENVLRSEISNAGSVNAVFISLYVMLLCTLYLY